MDSDPGEGPGKIGGGYFKSTDGGHTWRQLPQPGNRHVVNALAVDPQDPDHVYWGGCGGSQHGLYRSDDGGQSWQLVLPKEPWLTNMRRPDGTVYCVGHRPLAQYRPRRHLETGDYVPRWAGDPADLEIDPKNPRRMWISRGIE